VRCDFRTRAGYDVVGGSVCIMRMVIIMLTAVCAFENLRGGFFHVRFGNRSVAVVVVFLNFLVHETDTVQQGLIWTRLALKHFVHPSQHGLHLSFQNT